jgi:putative NADH-flavin reductase
MPRRPRQSSSGSRSRTSDNERRRREAALDKTLAGTFPASDPLSTNPNPDDETAAPAVAGQPADAPAAGGTRPAATVAILGATGFIGSALVNEACRRGHRVTAIARRAERVPGQPGVTAVAVDVNDTAGLAAILRGHDAVISAFNPGWKNPNLYDEQVRGTSSIIAAIRQAGVKRVLWTGGASGLEVAPGVRGIDNPNLPDWVRPGALATIEALEQLRQAPDLDWSFLAPSTELTLGERTGRFRLGGDQLIVGADGRSWISVQDFAVAMMDELERPAHIRQRFTVGY